MKGKMDASVNAISSPSPEAPPSHKLPVRYYALDALRGFAMVVTPLLHAAGLYMVLGGGTSAPGRHIAFNIIFFVIHMFHMEAFFVISGFFAAMSYHRRGARAFIRSRLWRIGVPLVIVAAAVWWYVTPIFLWFLIDLLIFGAVALVLQAAAGEAHWPGKLLRQILRLPWPAPVLALFTFPPMLFMNWGAVDVPSTLWPQPRLVIYYGVFFAFGWLLSATPEVLATFARRGWWTLGLGVFLLLVAMSMPPSSERIGLLPRYLCVLCVWTLVLGLIGVFQRRLDQPNRPVRYLSDASYWIYLVHLPVMFWLYGIAQKWELSALEGFAFVLTATMAISLVSYQLLVRHTPLGLIFDAPRERAKLQAAVVISAAGASEAS